MENSHNFRKKTIALFTIFAMSLGFFITSANNVFAQKQKVRRIPLSTQESETETNQVQIKDYFNVSSTVRIISYKYAYVGDVIAQGSGSGTIISEDGLILTNSHVIQDLDDDTLDAFEICITFDMKKAPDCSFVASVVAEDEKIDIAILKLEDKDIQGNSLPKLNALDYKTEGNTETGAKLTVTGYPSTGLDTITVTQGQISGYYEYNGIEYFKTDASVDFGNSGGTVIDEKGSFIGIPTFLISEENSLGYLLNINEAVSWIDEHRGDEEKKHEQAISYLRKRKKSLIDALDQKKYQKETYPKWQIESPNDWNFSWISERTVIIENTMNDSKAAIVIGNQLLPFEITEKFMDGLFKITDGFSDIFSKYERKKTEFNGHDAYLITYSFADTQSYTYYIPYGYAIISISYALDTNNLESSKKAHDEILKTFNVLDEIDSTPEVLETFTLSTPPFSISRVSDWYLIPNSVSEFVADRLVEIIRKDLFDGGIEISYKKLSEYDKNFSNEEWYEQNIDYYRDSSYYTIQGKNPKVIIDDLEGWSVTVTYEKESLETMKETDIYLRDKDHYFYIEYKDKEADYEKYFPQVKEMLLGFRDLRKSEPGKYDLGLFDGLFKDIRNHRYEKEISKLKEKGFLDGFEDENFTPEKEMTRAEVITTLIESKIKREEDKNLSEKDEEMRNELEARASDKSKEVNFADTLGTRSYTKYIRYAKQKGYVEGYEGNKFFPNRKITLVEALSMMFKVFEVPLWKSADEVVWFKPIMDKAYQIEILPEGLSDGNHLLTRSEFAFILEKLLEYI